MLDKVSTYVYLRLICLTHTSINYPLLQKVCIPDHTTNTYKIVCKNRFSFYPVYFNFLDEIPHHYVFRYNAYTKVHEVIIEL